MVRGAWAISRNQRTERRGSRRISLSWRPEPAFLNDRIFEQLLQDFRVSGLYEVAVVLHLESTICSTWKCFVEFAQKEKLITTLTKNKCKNCQGCVTKTTRKINWRVALNFFSLLTFNFDLTTLLLKTLLIGALGFHHFTKLFNRVTPSISLTENKVFWWTKLVSIDLVRYSRMSLVWSPTDTAA